MLAIMTFSILRLNKVTFGIMILTVTLSVKDTQQNNSKHSNTQFNDIWHKGTKVNDAQHNSFQNSETKHSDICNNGPNCDTQYKRHSAQQQ
jgi:hypothetical protein